MDVDGSPMNQNPGEIDQNLLLQFSCMNTTDREELISQFQRLLGSSVNTNTASFFLDMSNWNLQAAVCLYLDYALPQRTPSMSVKAAHGCTEPVPPGSRFVQNWTIANTGTESWPSCQLIHDGGETFGCDRVYVPNLPAGHSHTVTMELTAPNNVGKHRGYFNLITDRGDKFGDTLWVEVTVEPEGSFAIVEQLAALHVPGSIDNNIQHNQVQQQQWDDRMC